MLVLVLVLVLGLGLGLVLVLVLGLELLWSSQTKLPASTASLQWSGHARHARS